MTIFDYGFDPAMKPAEAVGVPARITAAYSGYYKFFSDSGSGVARLKKSAYLRNSGALVPATGDFVMIEWNPYGESRILSTIPRKTCFERRDPSASGLKSQVLAANVDTAFLLMSLNLDFSAARLERYLALAWKSCANPVVLLTKSDLVDDPSPYLAEAHACAGKAPVITVSAKTGDGLSDIRKYVRPRETLVMLGSSGVGKSSLVNALAGTELMPTLEIREKDDKGRHTTTERELVVMPNGALVIDTPGVRELGMWEAGTAIDKTFSDVEELLGHCRFSDCKHETEPGCAIKAAIEDGTLSADRWEAYRKLQEESFFSADRDGHLSQRRLKFAKIAKTNKPCAGTPRGTK